MKKNLHITLWLTAFLVAINIPLSTNAQCLCDGGTAPTPLKHQFVLDTTSTSSSDITFPKFDPAVGVLTCVRFEDTLSLITTSSVNNTSMQEETYIFNLRVVNNFAGPGMNVSAVAQRTYGPDVLAAYGQPGYQIVYGPDTLFTNSRHLTNSTNVVGYLGNTGSAVFKYTVNGGLTSDLGGINYNYSIVSKYWGSFGLTYFWCPNAVLSTNIKNFAAVKSNKNINLSWIVGNDLISNTYEIQVSKNGREFFSAGSTKANAAASGLTSKYTYQYNPNQAVTGQLYFRIRQVDANGKVSYSTVKALNMDSDAASAFTAYPNPATSKVSLQFDANLDGEYHVDVTNQVGQRMMSKPMKLKNTSVIDINLSGVHAPGMYYVRVKNAQNGQIFTNKVMINR